MPGAAEPGAVVRRAPDRRLRDEIAGEPLVLEAGESPGTVRVVEVPAGARIIHTYWFAWAAFHPETEIHGQAKLSDGRGNTGKLRLPMARD